MMARGRIAAIRNEATLQPPSRDKAVAVAVVRILTGAVDAHRVLRVSKRPKYYYYYYYYYYYFFFST